ncbi:MAG: Zn-dependent hydrolase [Woeseiaceae bacterium]|nr:Zn-dependent hydrolase [Woeseiaceae bacterium]
MSFQFLFRQSSVIALCIIITSCAPESGPAELDTRPLELDTPRLNKYADFILTADLNNLSNNQKKMISLLIDASKIMDNLYWRQSYGDNYKTWLELIDDADIRRIAELNYGPWDRLEDNKPFMESVGARPLGANFYPTDMTKEELERAYLPGKNSHYSLIRRDEEGMLKLIPYHVAYNNELKVAAKLLYDAAEHSDSKDFGNFLKLRAAALISDEYQVSDMFWTDVQGNDIDIVIGPIKSYEDTFLGYRKSYESHVLVKDLEWSERLSRFASFLPILQESLPVSNEYKLEVPNLSLNLNIYDAVYYAGASNVANKVTENMFNDESSWPTNSKRRLQPKNVMRAKFDKFVEQIAHVLIDQSQQPDVSFDAFFFNIMFNELAHNIGIKNTIDGRGKVREVLLDMSTSIEEAKADILGLYMITELHKAGELGDVDLHDHYVTFMAESFCSIRFGALNAHSKAKILLFNFFQDQGAFVRDMESGRYHVDFDQMNIAITRLSQLLLTIQGDGDYEGAVEFMESYGTIKLQMQSDLNSLFQTNIPVGIAFRQGKSELNIE